MSLSESKIRHAYARDKIYFLADDDGLSLKVEPSGNKSWSYRYTHSDTGKRSRIKLGIYPEMSLKAARAVRDTFKEQKFSKSVLNPQKIVSFKEIAQDWLDFKIKKSLHDQPRCGVIELAQKCLSDDIEPILGHLPFAEVKRYDLVQVIKKIEARQVKEPVKKAYSYLNQIYDYAVAMGYCEYNIAHGLNKIIINQKVKKNYPYLNATQLTEFMQRLQKVNVHPIIKKALLFKLYTGVRGAELLSAQPHHFDLKKKVWKIPASHIKQFRRKVLLGHDIPDFIVPLSDQAVEILQSALAWSYGDQYVFASPRQKHKPIHFNTLNLVIRKMGYTSSDLSSHGLRSTFSTILNESGLFQANWIEAQLSHVDRNKTRASYNHADYLAQRTEMMQWWGNFVSEYTQPS